MQGAGDTRGYGIALRAHSIVGSTSSKSRRGKSFLGRSVEFYPFDEEYVRRLRDGEPEVEEHFSLYFAGCLRMKLRGRFSADMDDIIQDTFLRALEKLRNGELRQAESLGAFVLGICRNLCLERLRPKRVDPLTDDVSESLRSTDDPERDAVDSERMRALRRAVQQMPDKDRRLLIAYFFEERSKTDLCREFGVSREYLRVCLHRVKKSLKRRFLQKYDETFKPNDEKKDH